MILEPQRIQFTEQVRPEVDDPTNKGLNCKGCLFDRQRAAVCKAANDEAKKRGLRDCDAVDQFGDVVIYVRCEIDPRQRDLIGEVHDRQEA